MLEPSGVLETFFVLRWVLVACVHTHVKIHWSVHLKLVPFVYVLQTQSINKSGFVLQYEGQWGANCEEMFP